MCFMCFCIHIYKSTQKPTNIQFTSSNSQSVSSSKIKHSQNRVMEQPTKFVQFLLDLMSPFCRVLCTFHGANM